MALKLAVVLSLLGMAALARTALAQGEAPTPSISDAASIAGAAAPLAQPSEFPQSSTSRPAPGRRPGRTPPLGPVDGASRGTGTATPHVHNGFYLRMGLGAGYANLDANAGTPDASVKGSGVTLDLLLGGTPAPGLAVGGGVVLTNVFGPRLTSETGGAHAINNMPVGMVGALGDYYLDDTKGVHLQGIVGVAAVQIDDPTVGTANLLWGPAVVVALGHDFWVGDQWSIGPMVRLFWASLKNTDTYINDRHTLWSPSLLFSATLH